MDRSRTHKQLKVLCALPFYREMISESCVSYGLREVLEERFPKRLFGIASRHGCLQGLLTLWHMLTTGYDVVVTKDWPSTNYAMYFDALFRPTARRFTLLEFMPPGGNRFRDRLYGFALRRTAKRIQVLTNWEREHYAARFGVPMELFHYVPWFLSANAGDPGEPGSNGVVSSGRGACDWDTLFRAADGCDWNLTVICGKQDLEHVQELNKDNRAKVLSEISVSEHDRYVAEAKVYVLALRDVPGSCGQVRLCHATTLGTAVVATNVRGLDGYCVDGETALMVNPGDHTGLRTAVEKLLSDTAERNRLRMNALEWSRRRTYRDYAADIRKFILRTEKNEKNKPQGPAVSFLMQRS